MGGGYIRPNGFLQVEDLNFGLRKSIFVMRKSIFVGGQRSCPIVGMKTKRIVSVRFEEKRIRILFESDNLG